MQELRVLIPEIHFILLDRRCLSPSHIPSARNVKITEDASPELSQFINPFHATNGISRSETTANTLNNPWCLIGCHESTFCCHPSSLQSYLRCGSKCPFACRFLATFCPDGSGFRVLCLQIAGSTSLPATRD